MLCPGSNLSSTFINLDWILLRMYVMDIFGDPQTNTKIETLIINSQGILNKMDVRASEPAFF